MVLVGRAVSTGLAALSYPYKNNDSVTAAEIMNACVENAMEKNMTEID